MALVLAPALRGQLLSISASSESAYGRSARYPRQAWRHQTRKPVQTAHPCTHNGDVNRPGFIGPTPLRIVEALEGSFV